jgi:hypothetical protein
MLAQVVGGILRIEHDCGVEKGEKHDQADVEQQEDRLPAAEPRRDRCQECDPSRP